MTTATPPRLPRPLPSDGRPRQAPTGRQTPAIDPFRILRRYLLAIIASGFLGTAVGVVAFFMFQRFYPLYSGDVLFEIRPGVADVREVSSGDIFQDQLVFRLGMTESMLLASRPVVEKAMRNPSVMGTTWFQQNFADRPNGIDEAIDDLTENLQTSVMRNTNLFQVRWSSHDPNDVVTVLNAIKDAYLSERKTTDEQVYQENLLVFQQQKQITERTIENLDQEIKRFIQEKGLQSLEDPRDSPDAYRMRQLTEKITETAGRLSQSEASLQQTAAKLQGTIQWTDDDRLRAEREPAVSASVQLVQQLKIELNEAEKKYGPNQKHVQNVAMRLRSAEDERDQKIEDVITLNLQAALRFYEDQVEQLRQVLQGYEDEQEEYQIRLRDLAEAQSEYQSLITRRELHAKALEADMSLEKEVELMRLRADASRVKLARKALMPRELSFPRLEVIVPLAMLIVTGLTVGLIFLRELTDQRVKSASDLAVLPNVGFVGMVPDLSEDPTKVDTPEMIVRRHPHSVLAESYRQTFSLVRKSVDRAGHQTLLVMGALPGSGTTTVITNLAATWAAAGRRVAVVDANFRRPRLAEAMGVDAQGPGLGDILAGIVTFSEAHVRTEEGITVVPVGSPPNRVFELLETRQFDSLVAELRDDHDLVIFDAPPAVVAGEAMVLANKLDASLLVVRANQEHRGLVARLTHQLGDSQSELLGIVLNRPRGTAGGYFKKNFATIAAYSASKS